MARVHGEGAAGKGAVVTFQYGIKREHFDNAVGKIMGPAAGGKWDIKVTAPKELVELLRRRLMGGTRVKVPQGNVEVIGGRTQEKVPRPRTDGGKLPSDWLFGTHSPSGAVGQRVKKKCIAVVKWKEGSSPVYCGQTIQVAEHDDEPMCPRCRGKGRTTDGSRWLK